MSEGGTGGDRKGDLIEERSCTRTVLGGEIVVIETTNCIHAHVDLKVEIWRGHVVVFGIAVALVSPPVAPGVAQYKDLCREYIFFIHT